MGMTAWHHQSLYLDMDSFHCFLPNPQWKGSLAVKKETEGEVGVREGLGGSVKKSMGSRRIWLIHSFPPGQLYTNFIFNSYLNIAYLTKVLKTAQFWHEWQLLILGSTGTVLNSGLHFPSHVFPHGEDAPSAGQEVFKQDTFTAQHRAELGQGVCKTSSREGQMFAIPPGFFFYSSYLK